MRSINRHSLTIKAFEVSQAIEDCGASTKLTDAVVLAGELYDEIHTFLDSLENAQAMTREVQDD
jgi:hypothetical protein